MFLKKFKIKNYRCIKDAAIVFNKGVNILIGENNEVYPILRTGFGVF